MSLSEVLKELMMDTDRYGIANWVYFILIFALLIFIYNKVFRTRKLPILKSIILYVLLAIGAFMLLLFQVDAGLPIVYSLGVAVLLMLIVRIRKFIEARRAKRNGEGENS